MSPHWQNDIENYQWLEFIHRGEEPLPVQGVFTTYRANPQELVGEGRQNYYPPYRVFLEDSAIRTCRRRHWRLLRRTALRTPYSCFLGKIIVGHVVGLGGYLLIIFHSVLSYLIFVVIYLFYTPLFCILSLDF